MKPVHGWLKRLGVAGTVCLLTFPTTAWARPLYQDVGGGHGHGADGDPAAIGLSWSVLFMMSMPFVLIGLFGALLWRSHSPHNFDQFQTRTLSFLRRRWIYLALALIAAAALSALMTSSGNADQGKDAAVQSLKQYVQAIYPRDYAAAYPLISVTDRHVKPKEVYLRENESLVGFGLEIGRRLATQIQYKDLRAEIQGSQATIHVTLIVPDSDDPALNEILFAESATNAPLSEARKQALRTKLDNFIQSGKLPTFESQQDFTLVREWGQWRVFLNWADGITVKLVGAVAEGLLWEFAPAQPAILAQPGKTYRAVYRARNTTNQRITGKATRRIEPNDKTQYFHDLQCFCMIQETLQPGEEQEMQLVFTLDPDIPPDVREFEVSYVFYPVDKFPMNAAEE